MAIVPSFMLISDGNDSLNEVIRYGKDLDKLRNIYLQIFSTFSMTNF